jgi:hypothetical protein
MDSESQNIERIATLLRKARDEAPEPSPFLKTRVLARLRATTLEQEQKTRLRFWKSIALLGPALSAAAVFVFLAFPRAEFHAQVNSPVAVRVQIDQAPRGEMIAFAEIELPAGVHFYSSRFAELRDQRTLFVAWDSKAERRHLPIAVQSDSTGTKKIRVKLLDSGRHLVEVREITIRFEKGAA